MRLRQYDTYPIEYQCIDENNKPIDLTAAGTITFVMTLDGEDTPSVSGSATVSSPLTGLVRYDPADDDLSTPGMYRIEWKIDFSGDVLTLPRNNILWAYVMGATSI